MVLKKVSTSILSHLWVYSWKCDEKKKKTEHVNTEAFGNNGKKRCETSIFLVSKKDLSSKVCTDITSAFGLCKNKSPLERYKKLILLKKIGKKNLQGELIIV